MDNEIEFEEDEDYYLATKDDQGDIDEDEVNSLFNDIDNIL